MFSSVPKRFITTARLKLLCVASLILFYCYLIFEATNYFTFYISESDVITVLCSYTEHAQFQFSFMAAIYKYVINIIDREQSLFFSKSRVEQKRKLTPWRGLE